METTKSSQQILQLLSQYKSISAIARSTKLSRQTLYRVLAGNSTSRRTEGLIIAIYTRFKMNLTPLYKETIYKINQMSDSDPQ